MKISGNIPTLSVNAECLPEAWEKAVLAVWDDGLDMITEYDREGDPPSKDATVIVTVHHPFAEPRIHKNFPGGPVELGSMIIGSIPQRVNGPILIMRGFLRIARCMDCGIPKAPRSRLRRWIRLNT